MWNLNFTESGREDLDAIAVYIAQSSGSRRTALQQKKKLTARCKKLAGLPQTMGRDRSDLAPGLRSVTEGSYVILFRYVDETLEIVNVIEGDRDFPAIFADDPEQS